MACYWKSAAVLWAVGVAVLMWQTKPTCALCPLTNFTICSCNALNTGEVIIDCNAKSIQESMESLRETNLVGFVTQLAFLGAPDTALDTNVFQGLTNLRLLFIQHCMNLVEIRPGAFNSLTQLETLYIQECSNLVALRPGAFNSLTHLDTLYLTNNALEWLSAEPFEGIGSLLELHLDNNMLRNLRSDLQLFFTSINDTISLSNNEGFVCDCHLQWLAEFINRPPMVPPRVELDSTFCSDPPNTPIGNSAVDFAALACLDLCSLGYHNCHQQANCTQSGESVLCSCVDGYMGDGITCTQISLCDNISCVENATCEIVNEVNTSIAHCTCNIGYTGNGQSCVLIGECEETCSTSDDPNIRCIVSTGDGRIDCGSENVQQLQETLLLLNSNPSLDPGLVMFSSQLEMAARNISFAGNVPIIVDLLVESVNIFRGTNQYENETFFNLVSVGSDLLHSQNQPLWSQINSTSVSDHVTDLFIAMERLGEALFLRNGPLMMDQVITSDNIALVIAKPDCTSSDRGNITVSTNLLEGSTTGGASSLQLPPSVFGMEFNCSEVGIIAVVYDGVGPLLNLDSELIPNCTPTAAPLVYGQCKWSNAVSVCPELQVNSVVISAQAVSSDQNQTINQLDTSSLSEPIIITLHHENTTLEDPNCAFLTDEQTMLEDGSWETQGCQVVSGSSSSNITVCECFHLTSFALLMSPTGPTPPNRPLQIASTVGLCISIICLILTIILLFGLKLDTKRLHHIHRQLAIALCLAQLLFLVAADRTLVPSPDALCTLIAGLLHYLFLCTFAWQLVEGVHLYLFIVKVFFNEKIIWAYYPLAWGVPLVVVAITMGIRFCDYGSENFCWITNGNGANWAFHGPVLAVLAVNIVIMIIVIGVIVRARRKKTHDTFLLCTLIHASVVLLPILGITWILGFLIIGDIAPVVEWLFCIFTTLQGVMIFVIHCVLNKDVRKAFLKKMGCHEAAKKQERLTIRRSSTVQSMSQFSVALKRTFSFSRTRRASFDDITIFQLGDHTHHSLSSSGNSFSVARPNSARGRLTTGVTNPLHGIAEEGDSLPSSVGGSPNLSPCNIKVPNGKSVVEFSINDSPQISPDNSPEVVHAGITRSGNGTDLH